MQSGREQVLLSVNSVNVTATCQTLISLMRQLSGKVKSRCQPLRQLFYLNASLKHKLSSQFRHSQRFTWGRTSSRWRRQWWTAWWGLTGNWRGSCAWSRSRWVAGRCLRGWCGPGLRQRCIFPDSWPVEPHLPFPQSYCPPGTRCRKGCTWKNAWATNLAGELTQKIQNMFW